MKLFFSYLKERRRTLVLFLLTGGLFLLTFFFYGLPLKAVLYPYLLSAVIGGGALICDFLRVRQKHRRLITLAGQSAATLPPLPMPEGIEEQDYQFLIGGLQTELSELSAAASARYRDMVEYYTVWAHQIKTPIASMQLTLEQEDSPLSRRLSAEVFRIGQYVEMVLAFLRLDADTGDYLFREYDLDGIIKQAVAKLAAAFIDRKLSLHYEPVCRTVVTDDKWLSFVIEQILSNALKYTREGGVSIYCEEPQTLCIADTGIGIAPEDLPRIFEKGYTGYNGRLDKKASGLGLYLCKRICDKLGIGIGVVSVPEKGTVVRLDLAQYALKRE